MTEKEEDKGFSVKDRRIFSESGEPRAEEGEKEIRKEKSKAEEQAKQDQPGQKAGKQAEDKRDFAYPEVNFSISCFPFTPLPCTISAISRTPLPGRRRKTFRRRNRPSTSFPC